MNDRELLAVRIRYKETLFRSILEARWAVFFDMIGARWTYEPETFTIGKHYQYTPDFHLRNVSLRSDSSDGVYIEIKPRCADIEERDIFYMAFPRSLIAFAGDPPGSGSSDDSFADIGGFEYGASGWDNQMLFMKCIKCRHVKIEFYESNYMVCPRCGDSVTICDEISWKKAKSPFDMAIRAAKSARVRQTAEHPELNIAEDFRMMMALQL